jgi:outer membrane protein TolC
MRSRLELQALAANEAAVKVQARLARVGNYPRLEGQANAVYANPNQRIFPIEEKFTATWDVGVVLSWTPTDIPGASASEAQANARARELAATRSAVERGLRLEVAQALSAAAEAKAAIGVSGHVLKAVEESYRVRRELFRAGRSTMVELTDAETELTRARIDVVNARVGARIALAQLHHSMGRNTP